MSEQSLDPGRIRQTLDAWLPAFLEGHRGATGLYAEVPVTWHAAHDITTAIDRHMDDPSYARLRRAVPDLRRENTKVSLTEDGWVLQSTTVGTVDGTEVRVNACLVVHLDADHKIARFDEYADSASGAPFAKALGMG